MENYFNYFTEIEERYLQRRGGGLLLSTLDWALIETWKDAGIPRVTLHECRHGYASFPDAAGLGKNLTELGYGADLTVDWMPSALAAREAGVPMVNRSPTVNPVTVRTVTLVAPAVNNKGM